MMPVRYYLPFRFVVIVGLIAFASWNFATYEFNARPIASLFLVLIALKVWYTTSLKLLKAGKRPSELRHNDILMMVVATVIYVVAVLAKDDHLRRTFGFFAVSTMLLLCVTLVSIAVVRHRCPPTPSVRQSNVKKIDNVS